ncbi:hypothetical protein GJ496_011472 [Pomphorhynchus laevis]|nr:hypothetical protein GJ496_011472 [Pomphorhynchus laevis]
MMVAACGKTTLTSTATDIQPTSSYFTIFPSSVISSFYRIQISGANINTATSCSGDRSKAVTSLSGFAGNDNSSVGVKYQNRRHALVQSSSTCLSRSTTEQFGISSEEDNLIVSTHTIIRLVDESQPSSCEMNQQASNCALINGIVTGQSVVSGPATNESSKENNSAQPDHIVTKMRLDKVTGSTKNDPLRSFKAEGIHDHVLYDYLKSEAVHKNSGIFESYERTYS